MNQRDKQIRKVGSYLLFFWMLLAFGNVFALDSNQLKDIKLRTVLDNKTQVFLEFARPPENIKDFSLELPSQIILDIPNTINMLPLDKIKQKISLGAIEAINVVETTDRTRIMIEVINLVPYEMEVNGNALVVTLSSEVAPPSQKNGFAISSIDFRRGDAGEGRLIIELGDSRVPIDFKEENNRVVVEFQGAKVPDALLRKYDVKDFGTPIKKFSIDNLETVVQVEVLMEGELDKLAYQVGNQYIIEARPLTKHEKIALKSQKFKFTGEKISLNFQDIEVRAVLQLLADFTGLNLVTSDTVEGNVTLRLENVPWDQALDFILKSKGLSKREEGNVLLIAPSEEISAREQVELETVQAVEDLSPLKSEFIQVNYASAADMVKMLKSDDNSLLSPRGQVSVDERTNTLLVKDTEDKISEVIKLVEFLDVPVRQVVIETQIVETTKNLTDAFGVRLNGAATARIGKHQIGLGNDLTASRAIAEGGKSALAANTGLFFDFSEASAKGKLGISIAKLPGGTLLDLELQAIETEALGKILARPKLRTLNNQMAMIESGEEIPVVTPATADTPATVEYKKAVIKLEVTPQITPDNRISMALSVNNDSVKSDTTGTGNPPINTTQMSTNVLVDNGDTIVIGGMFKEDNNKAGSKIPLLGDLPLVGRIFRASNSRNEKREILIFVTPHIVKSAAENT